MSNTVLLIHGAWLNSRSWDAVKAHYEARGFTVHFDCLAAVSTLKLF